MGVAVTFEIFTAYTDFEFDYGNFEVNLYWTPKFHVIFVSVDEKLLTPNKTKVTIVTTPSDISPYCILWAWSINCPIFSENKFDLYCRPKKFFISDARIVKATAEPNAEDTGTDMNSTIKPRNMSKTWVLFFEMGGSSMSIII